MILTIQNAVNFTAQRQNGTNSEIKPRTIAQISYPVCSKLSHLHRRRGLYAQRLPVLRAPAASFYRALFEPPIICILTPALCRRVRISEILRKAASGQLYTKRRTYLIYTVRFKSAAPIGPAWSVSGAAKLISPAVLNTLPIGFLRAVAGVGKHISISALECGANRAGSLGTREI